MHKFVVITGIDGAGKNYVAEHLHQADQGSHLIETPTPIYVPIRGEIDKRALQNPAAHYLFYLSSVVDASQGVKNLLQTGTVYCVRYLLDTVVYHRAMGLPVKLIYETGIYQIVRPDLTIFLTVSSEDVRQNRLATRGKFTAGDKIVNQVDLRQRILSEYQRFASEYVKVDNTNRSIGEVVAEIQKIMGSS